MNVEHLRACLRVAHAHIGYEGRFTFTLGQEPGEPCYIAHWVRPGESAFEDCRSVGSGTLSECLHALNHYTQTYVRRHPTEGELGRTLGVMPVYTPTQIAAE